MHPFTPARLLLLVGLCVPVSCSDPVDPPRPYAAAAASALTQGIRAGHAVNEPPSVRVTTSGGRPLAGVGVHFAVQAGGGTLSGADPVTNEDGVAQVGAWTLGSAPGRNLVRATVDGLSDVDVVFEAMALPENCSGLVPLDLEPGEFVRLKSSTTVTYPCLLFEPQYSDGHEYLLLFENMSPTGGVSAALFPGAAGDTTLAFTLAAAPLGAAAAPPQSLLRIDPPHASASAPTHTWDFGAGRIREHTPDPPPGGVSGVRLVRGSRTVDVNSLQADPVIGDTIQVLMSAIPRLGIATGMQSAVIRHVSDHLIIAQDTRLTTQLVRESGGFNTPLTDADLTAIAAEYAVVARVQSDMLFQNRHNAAVESSVPHRITAVHSIMSANDVWGYTYSVSNYFVWDYWVGTDGSTKGLNQHPQRVTDNLFMHEIAHMRHVGMLERNGVGFAGRGNRWLVEGFARFSERLPVAARILGTTTPSRTDNAVLPRNPSFNNAYFLDDVPTYLHAGSSMYFGYHTSSFVFDYLADQVARGGGDWQAAVREFLLAGGSQDALDAVVEKWIPGTTFADLFTRARIALYTDDIGTSGLPAWTQYHQFRLRESRPAPQQLADQDPRVAWPRISMAEPASVSGSVGAGAAAGFILAGAGPAPAVIRAAAPSGPHAILSVTRIR